MAKTDVLTRKDMKEPDRFQQAATQAASWLAARRKRVVAIGAAAVAVLVAVAAVSALQTRRTARAGAAAADLLAVMGGEISAVPLPGFPGPFFPSEEAKQRAIVAAAEQVIAGHGGTPAGALAALAAGDAHVRLAEWDAARAAYERFLADASPDDSLRFGALEGLGLVEEGKGNLDAAAQAYERLAREVPAFADRADLDRARVLAASGKTAEAKELLAGFAEKHKESQLTAEASERLARLGGK
ncbi:MAG TPA: tetratricopeptide repeat protein [Anaeromyxobacter sp.]|nr:tetratricopeptide repeat protein [Anaeromyxobacter sp.]